MGKKKENPKSEALKSLPTGRQAKQIPNPKSPVSPPSGLGSAETDDASQGKQTDQDQKAEEKS